MRLTALLVALSAIPAIFAGCLGNDAVDSKTPPAPSPTAPTGPPAPPPPLSVGIDAVDYSFGGPAQIAGGLTKVTLANKGKELHHLQLVQIGGNKTFQDFQAAVITGRQEPWMIAAGGPNAAEPNATTVAFVDFKPGSYAMMCFIPSPDGTMHVLKGMMAELKVGAVATPAPAAPPADVSLGLEDFAFNLSRPVTAGALTFSATNRGAQEHEATLVRLNPGTNVTTFLATFGRGPPQGKANGGITGIAPAAQQSFTVTFTTGTYAFVCFLPDAATNRPHYELGMAREFSVA